MIKRLASNTVAILWQHLSAILWGISALTAVVWAVEGLLGYELLPPKPTVLFLFGCVFVGSLVYKVQTDQHIAELRASPKEPDVEIANARVRQITVENWLIKRGRSYRLGEHMCLFITVRFTMLYRGSTPCRARLEAGEADIDWQLRQYQDEPEVALTKIGDQDGILGAADVVLSPNSVNEVEILILVGYTIPSAEAKLGLLKGLNNAALTLRVCASRGTYPFTIDMHPGMIRKPLLDEFADHLLKELSQQDKAEERRDLVVGHFYTVIDGFS